MMCYPPLDSLLSIVDFFFFLVRVEEYLCWLFYFAARFDMSTTSLSTFYGLGIFYCLSSLATHYDCNPLALLLLSGVLLFILPQLSHILEHSQACSLMYRVKLLLS